MFFKSFATAAASLSLLAGFVSAYKIHDVFVGGPNGLKFSPEHITAAPGDRIRFTFAQKNHTVTESTFDHPCAPKTDAHGKQTGFFSGFMPVPETQTQGFPQFWIGVHDEKPIWAFCQQGNHCKQGMVFAVNAPADPSPKSFANWKAKAMDGSPPPAPATTTTQGGAPHASPDPYAAPVYGGGNTTTHTAPTTQTQVAAPATTTAPPNTGYPEAIPVTQTVILPSSTWVTVYDSYPGSANPTPELNGPKVHNVIVGAGGLVFQPSSIQAKPRDIVQFEFRAKNHTVTQSTFQAPCVKKAGGFDSGFVPTAADATVFTKWNFTVETTEPIWAFCAQGNHCSAGMVFSINAVAGSDINQGSFESNAKALPQVASTGSASSSAVVPTSSTITNSALGRFESSTPLLATVVLAGLMMAL